jgi:MoaA/NifB/PqqE/SkfB family radical SAM enzyme/ubiquinone/menaquinone biosynthesis C-methylase UbiE
MITNYQRIVFNGIPVYIDSEKPDWFIPTPKSDFILEKAIQNIPQKEIAEHYANKYSFPPEHSFAQITKLISRFNDPAPQIPYKGRSEHRAVNHLTECWFHITNQCNMSCRHCLFCSNPNDQSALSYSDIIESINTVYNLGCRIYYFTGGEPFIHPDFNRICDHILQEQDTHIVVLTNGKNIKQFEQWLREIPAGRFHIQLSIDGMEENHDAIRGKGAFQNMAGSLDFLTQLGFPVSLAMVVNNDNVHEMKSLVSFAQKHKIKNLHYMWLFQKGNAGKNMFAAPEAIFEELKEADKEARKSGISIDNLEIFKSQVYSLPGTRFDLNNAGWESIAIGPDGSICPSPALIGENKMIAGNINEGIEHVWKHSNVMKQVRNATLINDGLSTQNPLKYLTGGGDIDHSFINKQIFVGADPYQELYNNIVLYLLTNGDTHHKYQQSTTTGLIKRMGEQLNDCDEDRAAVGFTHSNCVLSLPGHDGYTSVRSFYSSAAEQVNEEIVNPVQYDENDLTGIPEEARVRSYGCGSPVMDCRLKEGETLVDLGSGTGTECFIAAKKVGQKGAVHGIDMADNMLNIANMSAQKLAQNIGYANVQFHKGFLEHLPLKNETADVVISNCVINLSPDKRQTYNEIMRVLKPGGRICIADIVSTDSIPLDIKYNEKLRGECIGGAMRENELFALLEDSGFEKIYVEKRFLYRQIKGFNFYSLTYSAFKPSIQKEVKTLLYRGPHESITLKQGIVLNRGIAQAVEVQNGESTDDSIMVLDHNGNPDIVQETSCSCFTAPEHQQKIIEPHNKGCMVCGTELAYLENNKQQTCFYCKKTEKVNTVCEKGHYVCNECHSKDAAAFIKSFAKRAPFNDMVEMMQKIREHPSMRIHGPEHHSMVPAIMVSVYKNLGGDVRDEDIETAVERGQTIAGGSCAFMGVCGAVSGVGTGFSILMKANPYKAKERKILQNITKEVLAEIAGFEAARCCQRDCFVALKAASKLSSSILDKTLPVEFNMICSQYNDNKECIGNQCPLWK